MKEKHKMFYVEFMFGCTLVKAKTQTQAKKSALAEWGRSMYISIRPANDEDIDWVKAMSGATHEFTV